MASLAVLKIAYYVATNEWLQPPATYSLSR